MRGTVAKRLRKEAVKESPVGTSPSLIYKEKKFKYTEFHTTCDNIDSGKSKFAKIKRKFL